MTIRTALISASDGSNTDDGFVRRLERDPMAVGENQATDPETFLAGGRYLDDNRQPERYGMNLCVSSVAHLRVESRPDFNYCAILIDVSFRTKRNLVSANVPFRIVIQENENETPSCDVPFFFPKDEERVQIGSVKVRRETSRLPSFSVPSPLGDVSFGGMGTRTSFENTLRPHITRNGVKLPRSPPLTQVQVKWCFKNSDKDSHFPIDHKLLLIVSRKPRCRTPPFQFTVILTDRLKVEPGRLSFGPPKGGWEIRIKGNYEPDKVNGLLHRVRDGQCQVISLNALIRGNGEESMNAELLVPAPVEPQIHGDMAIQQA